MVVLNPFNEIVQEFRNFINEIGKELGKDLSNLQIGKTQPKFGYLTTSMHNLVKEYPDLSKVIEKICKKFNFKYIGDVKFINGFLNVNVNIETYGKLVLNSILQLGNKYGISNECPQGKYIIEHTSANPIHPLHVGHARNAVLGDTLARLLRFCGCSIRTHFYLDDCGDQVAYAAFGFNLVRDLVYKRIEEGIKPDHVIGLIYSTTYLVSEIKRITDELKKIEGDSDKYRELLSERDELIAALAELKNKDNELVTELIKKLSEIEDINYEIKKLSIQYEKGVESVRKFVKEMIQLVLNGFKQTLTRLGITFDSWDWESEITIDSGYVYRVLNLLKVQVPTYLDIIGNVITFRADEFVKDFNLWDELSLPKYIPKVTLTRSDSSTLYVTRDIAYAYWCMEKFNPDKLIRVIAVEQTHPQAHVRIILYAIGFREWAKKIIHYAYELVNIPGFKMSGRKGKYVTLDELIDEAKKRVTIIVKDRFTESEVDKVSEAVAIGAIRYTLLSVNPSKVLTFTWDKVLNFKQNSGPFIQYTYVRARSIIEKSGIVEILKFKVPKEIGDEEIELILQLGEFPKIIAKAANELRPDYLVEYVNKLALTFNSFYEKYPVLTADEPWKTFRLTLTMCTKIVLENVMNILGIPILERM